MLQSPVYSLFALCWRTPRLIDQVEEGVKVGRIELPIVRTGGKKKKESGDMRSGFGFLNGCGGGAAGGGAYFLSSSLWARELHSGQRCSL